MARQLFIGLITEGPTDVRFLQSVVERTFIDVAFECENDLEPYVKCLTVEKVRLSFNEYVEKASRRTLGQHAGRVFLSVHILQINDILLVFCIIFYKDLGIVGNKTI